MTIHLPRLVKHSYHRPFLSLKKKLVIGMTVAGISLHLVFTLPEQAIVGSARVVDGDTLVINQQKIRIFGIDAPEMKQLCYFEDQPVMCGIEAKKALEAFAGQGPLKCTPKEKDRYQRTIASCEVGKVDIGAAMVKSGHAVAYTFFSEKYLPLEEKAKRERVGMWRYRFEKPWVWRNNQS